MVAFVRQGLTPRANAILPRGSQLHRRSETSLAGEIRKKQRDKVIADKVHQVTGLGDRRYAADVKTGILLDNYWPGANLEWGPADGT